MACQKVPPAGAKSLRRPTHRNSAPGLAGVKPPGPPGRGSSAVSVISSRTTTVTSYRRRVTTAPCGARIVEERCTVRTVHVEVRLEVPPSGGAGGAPLVHVPTPRVPRPAAVH